MWEQEIKELLELYSTEEVFDILDITIEEVLEHLLEGGFVVLPPFLERDNDAQDQDYQGLEA